MAQIFKLAREFVGLPAKEIEVLLKESSHEARVGAVSIMDYQARDKRTSDAQRRVLFELYIHNHDRIDNWDLVDRSAPYVVGGYLADKPRDILYRLARSDSPWERRTAITATYFFIRQGDVDDTFKIAELLIHDPHDLVQKAVGGWVREAGKRDRSRLFEFLDRYAATMPRTMLRYAIEQVDPTQRKYYLGLKQA